MLYKVGEISMQIREGKVIDMASTFRICCQCQQKAGALLSLFHGYAGTVGSHQVAILSCGRCGPGHATIGKSLVSFLRLFQSLLSNFLCLTVE